jgi:hypothetical protein
MDPNPYSSPSEADLGHLNAAERIHVQPAIAATVKRRIAICVILLPVILAWPVRYWAFHLSGNWFVNFDIPPRERQLDLTLMYCLLMAAIAGVTLLPGLLLLFADNYRRSIVGCLLVPAFVFFALALVVFATMVDAFYRFS